MLPIQRPYRLNIMVYQYKKLIKNYLESKKLKPIISQGLKKLANKLAKKLYTDTVHAPKKANIFQLNEIGIIIKYLWSLGIKEKEIFK